MPVDNDTGSGTQYTLSHPRPNQPQPGDIAAAVGTAVAVAFQLYSIWSSEGEASGLAISALVATIVGLLVLVVTIVQDGVSQDVYFDVPSNPKVWTTLAPQEKGGPLPSDIKPESVILFRDPDTSAGTKIQTFGGGVKLPSQTVHLHQNVSRSGDSASPFYCTIGS